MNRLRIAAVLLALLVAVSLPLMAQGGSEVSDDGTFKMTKEARIIVPANPGGGSDISARMIADIVNRNKMTEKNFVVENRPGGACAVGYNYVGSQKGDPYTLLSLHSGNIIVSAVNGWEMQWDDLTDIIAIMAWDDVTLCVRTDGPFQTIEDVIEYAKANPGKLKFGSDQRGNTSQLGFELMKKYIGLDMNYVQYDSSGDVASALLGGHVDVGILNPGECIGQVRGGLLKPIVTFAPERIAGELFGDAPTFVELGYPEITYREFRGLSGAKDMPEAALNYYVDLCKRITETEEWNVNYLEANNLQPAFMPHEEAMQFTQEHVDQVMQTFEEVGYFDLLK